MASKKNRTLVRIDGELIQVVKDPKKGLVAKRLSDDDLLEMTVLEEDGVEPLLNNDLNKVANQAYKELKQEFKNQLKSNVLKLVGFDNRWNDSQWEVDRVNGKSSLLTEVMAAKIQAMFRTSFDAMLQDEIDELIKPLKPAILEDFKREFRYHAHSEITQKAAAVATAAVKEIITSNVDDLKKELTSKTEIAFLGQLITNKSDDEDED